VSNKPFRKHEHFIINVTNNDAITPVSVVEKQATDVVIDVFCSICQEPVGKPNPDGITESWSLLPCGHKFGSHCIKQWLGLIAEQKPCCPVCRRKASFACGHPALPTVLSEEEARRKDGCRGPDKSNIIQYRVCDYCKEMGFFCRKAGIGNARGLVLGRSIKSLWRRLTRMRRGGGEIIWTTEEDRRIHFQRWWNKQEPQSVEA
jgi:hypothetical protein